VIRSAPASFAETRRGHPDPRLGGRTYAIPFDTVWRAALALADGGQRGWRLLAADDEEGVILAEATTPVLRFVDDIMIYITLDEDAQTRVDAHSGSRVGRSDFGTNARRLDRFFRRLDARVASERPAAGEAASPMGAAAGR
jgi:hypothetical protein